MGRKKLYTPTRFKKAIKEYFDSITFDRVVMEVYDTEERTNKGKPIYAERASLTRSLRKSRVTRPNAG